MAKKQMIDYLNELEKHLSSMGVEELAKLLNEVDVPDLVIKQMSAIEKITCSQGYQPMGAGSISVPSSSFDIGLSSDDYAIAA